MMDLLLEEGDLKVFQGDLGFCVSDIQTINQAVSIRLKTLQGEWFMDTQIGIPYLTEILGQKPSERFLRHIFAKQIGNVPGVEKITEFNVELGQQRSLIINVRLRLTDDSEISIKELVEI
jgi:hypothetical protein